VCEFELAFDLSEKVSKTIQQILSQTFLNYFNSDNNIPYLVFEKFNNALLFYVGEQYLKAIDEFNAILSLGFTDSIIRSNLASSYIKIGDYDNAINQCKLALIENPVHAKTYYNLACAFSLMKRNKEALNNLQNAIHLDENLIKNAQADIDFKNISSFNKFKNLTYKEI
jgi:tetratricopeptide (TPR) repeat protein